MSELQQQILIKKNKVDLKTLNNEVECLFKVTKVVHFRLGEKLATIKKYVEKHKKIYHSFKNYCDNNNFSFGYNQALNYIKIYEKRDVVLYNYVKDEEEFAELSVNQCLELIREDNKRRKDKGEKNIENNFSKWMDTTRPAKRQKKSNNDNNPPNLYDYDLNPYTNVDVNVDPDVNANIDPNVNVNVDPDVNVNVNPDVNANVNLNVKKRDIDDEKMKIQQFKKTFEDYLTTCAFGNYEKNHPDFQPANSIKQDVDGDDNVFFMYEVFECLIGDLIKQKEINKELKEELELLKTQSALNNVKI